METAWELPAVAKHLDGSIVRLSRESGKYPSVSSPNLCRSRGVFPPRYTFPREFRNVAAQHSQCVLLLLLPRVTSFRVTHWQSAFPPQGGVVECP